MKLKLIFAVAFTLFFVSVLAFEKNAASPTLVKQKLQKLSDLRSEAEKNDDIKTFIKYYSEDAISMPEYQPILQGISEIEKFYTTIFQRQHVKQLERTIDEIVELGNTLIEIGTFTKEYGDSNSGETIIKQRGKYWNVWIVQRDGTYKLKGETFGYFHAVENPDPLVLKHENFKQEEFDSSLHKQIPFELKAYNALMEKAVTNRDGLLRTDFFTDDAKFMPFAHATVSDVNNLRPYLIEYNSGEVTIESISVYSYHYEYFDDYILEYPKFRVKWSTPGASGRSEGKGIRIWKRQRDGSLKIWREIGTHNHI